LNYSFDKTIKIRFREAESSVPKKYGKINYIIIPRICQVKSYFTAGIKVFLYLSSRFVNLKQ